MDFSGNPLYPTLKSICKDINSIFHSVITLRSECLPINIYNVSDGLKDRSISILDDSQGVASEPWHLSLLHPRLGQMIKFGIGFESVEIETLFCQLSNVGKAGL